MIDANSPPLRRLLPLLAAGGLLAGCGGPPSPAVQGYVEGEYVYVSSPAAGTLRALPVQRGLRVRAGAPLFALDDVPEKAARDQAAEQLAQARATLEDLKKGKRPSEIQSAQALLLQAQAALALADQDLARQLKLAAVPGGAAEQDLDRARSTRDQDSQRVAQLQADLQTAQTGSRDDQIAAAAAAVRALQAALDRADWDLAQKSQPAPAAGLVFDTLYRPGEWVAAGRPVVVLLPPENVKVRAFVAESLVGAIHPGDPVSVTVDGLPQPLPGKVSFISPQAEYTPPVIYSQESRGKLVFMVETVFEAASATNLHPGQPVDVRFGH
ncbi:MAG TPA: HlyD family efflux transporter periplasmic adaptor subunit [Candidatus Acidoferrum sp.]|nr:HlyD family efflux transporter periplasmic adaptor subunit [Candidatus Acidoferrum sp.]